MESVDVENPCLLGNTTRLKVVLPVRRLEAWRLIGTGEGLSEWFPVPCKGRMGVGENVEFGRSSGLADRFRVLDWKEGDRWEIEWRTGGLEGVRYSLRGEKPLFSSLRRPMTILRTV